MPLFIAMEQRFHQPNKLTSDYKHKQHGKSVWFLDRYNIFLSYSYSTIQFFHIWSAKTLRQSMFTHGIFANKVHRFLVFYVISLFQWTIVAVTVEIILLGIFVYCPGIDTWLGGAPVPVTSWGVVAAIGLLIFAYNETRKFFIRKAPKNRIVRAFFKL